MGLKLGEYGPVLFEDDDITNSMIINEYVNIIKAWEGPDCKIMNLFNTRVYNYITNLISNIIISNTFKLNNIYVCLNQVNHIYYTNLISFIVINLESTVVC